MLVKLIASQRDESNPTLILGKEYIVLTVGYSRKSMGGLYYRLLDENLSATLYNFSLFEIVDPSLPEDWQVAIEDAESFIVEPRVFSRPIRNSFWEDFFEGDSVRRVEAWKVLDAEIRKIQSFHGIDEIGLNTPKQ